LILPGPNEITIFRPDAAELLDGYKNTNTRDVWYDILHPRKALVFARDKEEMRQLRGSWSQAVSSRCKSVPGPFTHHELSILCSFPEDGLPLRPQWAHSEWLLTLRSGVTEYTPRILRLADELINCIISRGPGVPINVNDIMSWFAFDAMGEITFGEDFGMLQHQRSVGDLLHQRTALALLAPLNDATWIAHAGFRLAPWLSAVKGWWAAVEFCESRMKRRVVVRRMLLIPNGHSRLDLTSSRPRPAR
jgi:hypothetical protein